MMLRAGTDAPGALALGWALIALWAGLSLASVLTPAMLPYPLARYLILACMVAFTFVHGARRYGAPGIALYFVLAVLIANGFENLSITTGFPFGSYHHTAAMGPKFLHVPLIIGPIFAAAGYLGWILAGCVLGEAERGARSATFAQPLIAAFVTTSWDLCVDPIGGTLNRDWVWAAGGGWFGVPWRNFFGWLLTMWVIYQVFALYLAWWHRARLPAPGRGWWLQAVVFWTLIALQFPLLYALVPDRLVHDPSGAAWQASALLESMAIVSVFTMLFTALLAYCALARANTLSR
jgi:uncharacterized membrane protein